MEIRDLPESEQGTVEFTTNLDAYLNLTQTWIALGTCMTATYLYLHRLRYVTAIYL